MSFPLTGGCCSTPHKSQREWAAKEKRRRKDSFAGVNVMFSGPGRCPAVTFSVDGLKSIGKFLC